MALTCTCYSQSIVFNIKCSAQVEILKFYNFPTVVLAHLKRGIATRKTARKVANIPFLAFSAFCFTHSCNAYVNIFYLSLDCLVPVEKLCLSSTFIKASIMLDLLSFGLFSPPVLFRR